MNKDQPSMPKKAYEPPAVTRVVLDPVKEMLTVCTIDQGGKLPGACVETGS